MGYLFLLLSLTAGVTKGYCGKRTSGFISGFRDAMLASTVRMGICVAVGLILVLLQGDGSRLSPTGPMLFYAAVFGVSTAVSVVTWMVAVKKSAYMMMDIFMMLGVSIPLVGGSIFLGEPIKTTQWLGLVILMAAVVLICSYNNTIKTKITPYDLLILIVSGATNGIVDLSSKLFVKRVENCSPSVFNLYAYAFAGITLLVWFLLTTPRHADPHLPAPMQTVGRVFPYVAVMALCLYACSYFKTLAAAHLDAVLLYPLSQGASLILSTVMAAVLFREKITVKAVIGIATAFVALLIINVL